MCLMELDRTDRLILQVLQEEGRLTNQELAARVNLSPSPCLRRVKALERAGVIRQYVALVDPKKVGLGLLAYVTVKLERKGRASAEEFARAIQSWKEVVACYAMTGDMDYLLRVLVEDLDHYSAFVMEKLLKLPNVLDVKSNFVLERLKDTTAVPL
ncbi:MAG TPA: Lrp/AsnC family transcriptional regulator [Burkholderiales bacterium]